MNFEFFVKIVSKINFDFVKRKKDKLQLNLFIFDLIKII
jgi:hypothetical protein